ncbi:MAG: DUF3473 domain-containing protein [Candidatus Zixiibacteriota bacterium]|jgi:polysaccharide deacetylase family protein (PEP-CTERM system associated)
MDYYPNLLTVDLEEWFVIEALAQRYSFDDWSRLPSTVVPNTRRLLELFRRKNVRATWFVLGWSAERYPDLMRAIVDSGHEIACHSYRHRRVDLMDPETFRRDTEMATEKIATAVGFNPVGYRAPSWSINASVAWAFEILADLGYEYDSSIFPIKHDIYGMPEGPRSMFKMKFDNGKSLWEVPSSTYRLFGRNMPVSGGGYLRHSPYWYSRMMINRLNRRDLPVNIYIHPWELDPETPRIKGLSSLQRLRLYGSTKVFLHKLDRLLSDFEFTSISDFIKIATKRRIGFERS